MPEDRNCKLLQASRGSDKKKKKRKKASASTSPPENPEKPQAASLPPETLPVSLLPPQSQSQLPKFRATSKRGRERPAGSRRRSKKHPKDSQSPLTATNKTSGSGSPARGCEEDCGGQARESLRWEGVLEDPLAEEKRLELYRANRRQRYLSHRETVLQEILHALRQTFPQEGQEKKAQAGSD